MIKNTLYEYEYMHKNTHINTHAIRICYPFICKRIHRLKIFELTSFVQELHKANFIKTIADYRHLAHMHLGNTERN